MRKMLLMAMLAVSTMAFADDYQYLTMGYNSIEKSILLETIQKITFENGNVVVATSNGNETFPQSQMEKMYFSTEPTAIKSVSTEKEKTDNTVYDLSGRRVMNPQKGIYIVDGKKVVIK